VKVGSIIHLPYRGAGENYHAVENPMQTRNRNIISGGAVIRKVVIEDKDKELKIKCTHDNNTKNIIHKTFPHEM
jgi:hypothetical protein